MSPQFDTRPERPNPTIFQAVFAFSFSPSLTHTSLALSSPLLLRLCLFLPALWPACFPVWRTERQNLPGSWHTGASRQLAHNVRPGEMIREALAAGVRRNGRLQLVLGPAPSCQVLALENADSRMKVQDHSEQRQL